MFVLVGTQRDAKATKDRIQVQVSLLMLVLSLYIYFDEYNYG